MDEILSRYLAARERFGCFSELPGLVRSLFPGGPAAPRARDWLGGLAGRYETVVLLFIDALGLRFLEQYPGATSLLHRIGREGRLCEISSQFPSTTAAHVTCMHSGLSVAESGVYEWHLYEPHLDAMISPLLFSYSGDARRESLRGSGVDPGLLFPTRTLYQDLADQGVASHLLQSKAYAASTYSTVLAKGAHMVPYRTLPEAFVLLEQVLGFGPGPRYCLLYFDSIDAIGHVHGPNSPQLEAEISAFFVLLERLFLRRVRPGSKHTLFLLTADHGQVETSPDRTIYLNRQPELGALPEMLQRNRRGDLLVPAGSCRDFFLHVRPEALSSCQALLQEFLGDRAWVAKVADLAEWGVFGPADRIAPAFWGRVGNLVILPRAGEAVWWFAPGKFEQNFLGHHGGLTPEETRIPLVAF